MTECQQQRLHPEKLRSNLYQLALDWILLRTTLPTPPPGLNPRRNTNHTYGHPAEWASDKAATITEILTGWHETLAEHRNETPPRRNTSEQTQVIAAWKYLECRTAELAELVEPEALNEIPALHHNIRHVLGYTNPPQALPLPCPNTDCELRTLQRHIRVGSDYIQCGHCGWTADETHYPFIVRMALDTLIDRES